MYPDYFLNQYMFRCDITLPRYASHPLEVTYRLFFILTVFLLQSDLCLHQLLRVKVSKPVTVCCNIPSKPKRDRQVLFFPEKVDFNTGHFFSPEEKHETPSIQKELHDAVQTAFALSSLYLNDIGVLQLQQDCNFLSHSPQIRIIYPAVLKHPLLPDELYDDLHR